MKVAAPVPLASAVIVTFCGVDQLAEVKVREPPAVTERPELPAVLVVLTVTLALGAEERATAIVPVDPCETLSVVGLTVTLGLAATVTPAGAETEVAP